MATKLPFVKYSCYGNNFVLLDETQGKLLSEKDLSRFADQATDVNFGIGADNLLVVQRHTPEALRSISSNFHYWKDVPSTEADYIFRMFEPNGDEALCCGNGLMCIAHHLYQEYGAEDTSIMTEVPLEKPVRTGIGTSASSARSWVDLGMPRRLPEAIINEIPQSRFVGEIQEVPGLRIKFREHDLKPYTNDTELFINGYLVFTGEPHMVVFLQENGLSLDGLSDVVFANSEGNKGAGPIFRHRIRYGTWLLDRVGHFINTRFREMFPIGINVNFVRTDLGVGTVEYRCYERGIEKETLACGTGAMAVAYVTSKILGVSEAEVSVLPHRCRWYRQDADIRVKPGDEGWVLNGQPRRIMEAVFLYDT